MTLLVRVATSADIPAMRELDLSSPFGARWSETHYREFFATADSRKHLVLTAGRESEVIAYLAASGVGEEWELENIVVRNTDLRRGVGRVLMEEFMERLQRENAKRLRLEVRESNVAARALYQVLGFSEESRRSAYYSNPGEDALILLRAL